MTTTRRAFSARTSFRNTPESDAQREVLHDVTVMLDGGGSETVRLMAEAPDDAIAQVSRMPAAAYASLPRVPKAQ
jgi:prephenate dehydrogenase